LDLFSIKFLDENNGYVLAGISAAHTSPNWELILSSSDGGCKWKTDTCIFMTHDDPISEIFPINNGILLGTGSHVYKSDDNGKTWIDVSPQFTIGNRINDLYILDSNTWLVAKGVDIYLTTNSGQFWQQLFHSGFMGAFGSFSFPSPTTGYISIGVVDFDHNLNASQIIKTIDGGKSWTVMNPEPWSSSAEPTPYVGDIQFVTDRIGYLSTYSVYKLYKTLDGGDNWIPVQNNNTISVYTLLDFIDEKIGYYCDGANIYSSNDEGRTWKLDNDSKSAKSNILDWSFLKTGVGFALTQDHRIIKRNN
jgi:hypothetical protein